MDDDNKYYNDTKILRRSMFICQHERDDHIMATKLRKLGLMGKRFFEQATDGFFGVSNLETCSLHSRALNSADILEHIVMHLPDRDLLNCRLVCKYWSVEMAYFLSKRKSLVIAGNHCLNAQSIIKKREDGHPTTLSKLGLFDVSSCCPLYRKIFNLFGCTLSSLSLECCNLSPSDLKQILFDHAPNIERFHFRGEYHPSLKPTRNINTLKEIRILNNGSLSLPKMKMLHWDEQNSQTDLKEFIEACPNLVALELRNFPLPRSHAYKNLKWDSLRSIFLSPKNVLESEHCKALSLLSLKLEKLTLFGLNSGDQKTMKSLSRFLSTLASSLQVLELWLDYGSVLAYRGPAHYSPLTVCLPKVTRLHTESEILGHLNNLRKLPAITDLEIVSNHQEHQNWTNLTKRAFVTSQQPCKLNSFRCGDIDGKSLEKVMKVFPMITSLNIYGTHVDDKLLRCIFTNLTLLVELTISRCFKTNSLRISDSGITGIRPEMCVKLQTSLDKFDDSVVQELKTQPDIGKLKLLQKLDLSFSISDMITDVSVFYGIARLNKLTTLQLPVCQITDESLSIIGKELEHLVILGISGCKRITNKAITDLKQQQKNIVIDSSYVC